MPEWKEHIIENTNENDKSLRSLAFKSLYASLNFSKIWSTSAMEIVAGEQGLALTTFSIQIFFS